MLHVRLPAVYTRPRANGPRSGSPQCRHQEYWLHVAVRGDAANWWRGPRHRRRGTVRRAGRRHRGPPDGRRRAPGDRRLGGRADGPVHAHRADRRRRRRGRVRRRVAGRDDLLQHLGGSGPRPGGALPAGDDGAVRGARAVHRAGPGPHAAGPQVPAGRHPAGPRPALLGDVGRDQQPGDAAARGVRHPGAAEGLRRGPRVGHAAAAARGDHPGDRERAVPAHHADRLHARRRGGSRDPGHGRARLGAPGGHADLLRRHVPRAAAPRPGGRAAGSGRPLPAAAPAPPPPGRPRRSPPDFTRTSMGDTPRPTAPTPGGRTRMGGSGRRYHPVRACRPAAGRRTRDRRSRPDPEAPEGPDRRAPRAGGA